MIHPVINNKISNKGISILLNTITGYDSEYELKSSSELSNDLLSIQLSSTTNYHVKIPILDRKPFSYLELNLSDSYLTGERLIIDCCSLSIDNEVNIIRSIILKENDKLINHLHKKLLEQEGVTVIDMELFKQYTFPKTEVESIIKYVKEYRSTDLINDSDSIKEAEHGKALCNIIKILNELSIMLYGKTDDSVISDKMKSCVEKCTSQPVSRISYKFCDSKYQLNISVNRLIYICMHESTADLSMLKDFNEFKELLDITARSFITRGKPLVITNCKSKVHFRDTILLAPAGAKSLAGIGSIYGEGFNKIEIGRY